MPLSTHAASKESIHVIQAPNLYENEVVTAFEVDVKYGAITALTGIPAGWSVKIINDPEWGDPKTGTKITGDMMMGPLGPDELAKIRIHILDEDSPNMPLSLAGTLSTVRMPDLDRARSIILMPQDFVTTK